jgi:hypothetical protein
MYIFVQVACFSAKIALEVKTCAMLSSSGDGLIDRWRWEARVYRAASAYFFVSLILM